MPAASVRYEAGSPRSILATVPDSAPGHLLLVPALLGGGRDAEPLRLAPGEPQRAQRLVRPQLDDEGQAADSQPARRQAALREASARGRYLDRAHARQPAEQQRPLRATGGAHHRRAAERTGQRLEREVAARQLDAGYVAPREAEIGRASCRER